MHRFRFVRGRYRGFEPGALGDTLFQGLASLVALGVVALLGVIAAVLLVVASRSVGIFGVGFLGFAGPSARSVAGQARRPPLQGIWRAACCIPAPERLNA